MRQAHSRRTLWLTPNRLTGLGWLGQGGSSSTDAPMQKAMLSTLFEPAWPVAETSMWYLATVRLEYDCVWYAR